SRCQERAFPNRTSAIWQARVSRCSLVGTGSGSYYSPCLPRLSGSLSLVKYIFYLTLEAQTLSNGRRLVGLPGLKTICWKGIGFTQKDVEVIGNIYENPELLP